LGTSVIFTVGPRWNQGNSNEEEKLKNCYINSLELAESYSYKSIAFPNISTGIYKFPKEKAAAIALGVVRSSEFKEIEKIVFVCFDEENFNIYHYMLT
jgi:Predicted phosphatase homologous to the C-terminal domain of histone macroH2A1